jgi:predicted dehydrogenase
MALRFGLIGLGTHGRRYAAHLLREVPGARLEAVCRRNREEGSAWAAAHGVRYFQDYRALLADPAVEAVAVVTTPNLHLEIAREAARVDKHLLLEKPLSVDGPSAARLVEAVAPMRATVMVAQTLRWNSVVRTLRAHIGEIEPLHAVSLSQRMEPSSHAWQRERAVAGGGNILHTGIHLFDLLRYFTGDEVEQVSCRTQRVLNPELEDAFAAVMNLRRSGASALVESSKATRSRSARIELVGQKGQLVGDHVHGYARRIVGYEVVDLAPPPPVFTVKEALGDFVRTIQRGAEPPVTAEDGLRAVELADACYRSAEKGLPARVERAAVGGYF